MMVRLFTHLIFKSGLQEWNQGNKQIETAFEELFPHSSADEEFEHILVLTQAYHNYKRKYVKHVSFNPKEENLSKVISSNQSLSNCFQL